MDPDLLEHDAISSSPLKFAVNSDVQNCNTLALHLLLSYSAALLKSTAVATETDASQSNEDIIKHNVKYYQPVHLSCSHPKSTQVQGWILPTGEVIKYPFKGHYSERVSIFDHGQLLSVRKTDNEDFGLYICFVLVGNNGMVTIRHGVNVDGPYYDPKQAENYRKNAIIGGIAAGIMLVLIIMLWIISDNCRKDRDKETTTVHLLLEGDKNPGMNCGQDSVEIVTREGITDGGHLAEIYETVEEGTKNQNTSANATSDIIEVVHETIGSAGYSTIETVSENRSNAHEMDLTSSNKNDMQSNTTVEDEADVEEDKQDESENNINFRGEEPGYNEDVIPPAVTILEENGVSEIDDIIFNPLEAEPGLGEKKDQFIPLIESTVVNNPTDPIPLVRCDVDERDDIQGLLNLDNTEVEIKENSKGPSSRHGSDHKENVIIQDGVIIIQKIEESTEYKIKETFDTKHITSDILENHGEIEMNAGEDKRDGGNGNVLSVSMSNENLEADTATLEPSGINERLISELPLQDALGYTDSQDSFGIVAGSEMSNRQTTE